MDDIRTIIEEVYANNEKAKKILIEHSEAVGNLSIELKRCIINKTPDFASDDTLMAASLMHDIGIIRCFAPDIECYGREPYIRHGILGAEIAMNYGLGQYVGVCKNHIGSGITKNEVVEQMLPLPAEDYLPQTTTEKLVCIADKFFSKSASNLRKAKTIEKVKTSFLNHGTMAYKRFQKMLESLGISLEAVDEILVDKKYLF